MGCYYFAVKLRAKYYNWDDPNAIRGDKRHYKVTVTNGKDGHTSFIQIIRGYLHHFLEGEYWWNFVILLFCTNILYTIFATWWWKNICETQHSTCVIACCQIHFTSIIIACKLA